jgi:hypothetical protein
MFMEVGKTLIIISRMEHTSEIGMKFCRKLKKIEKLHGRLFKREKPQTKFPGGVEDNAGPTLSPLC